MAINDAVDWARRPRWRRPRRAGPGRARSAPTPGALFGPVPWVLWDAARRPTRSTTSTACSRRSTACCRDAGGPRARRDRDRRADRRQDPGDARLRGAARSCRRSRRPASRPETVDVVAMSHLHFDHAGGLLLADGSRAFPRATIVAQRAEWEIALGDNPRLVASYDQPELTLVARLGRGGLGRRRARDPARACRSCRPAATRPATRRSSSGAAGAGARTLAFFGDLCMRPWAREPALGDRRSTTSRSIRSCARPSCSPRPPTRTGSSCCRTSATHPIGRLVRDRDRFRYRAGLARLGLVRSACAAGSPRSAATAPASSTGRCRPRRSRRSVDEELGRQPNTLYAWKTCPSASKPIV